MKSPENTPTEELASLRAQLAWMSDNRRTLADWYSQKHSLEAANARLRAENGALRELLKESADALESLFVTQSGLGMSSQTLTKLRAHLAQSEPGAGKEGA